MAKLYVVGVGPGSEDYLTFKAKSVADSAEILMGSKRSLELFQGTGAEKIVLDAGNMEYTLKLAVSRVEEGKSVVLLSTGDPGFSGVLKPLLKLAETVEMEVVPGISSVQLCTARLQIPWDDADLITLHGKGVSKKILDVLENGKPTIILPSFKVGEVAQYLMDNGVDPEKKVTICEKLSYPEEKIVETSLKNVLNANFSYMCVMVFHSI